MPGIGRSAADDNAACTLSVLAFHPCPVLPDLGFGDPGFNGGRAKTPPHLDDIAGSDTALVFHRFLCGGAVCSPTRASHLTGQ